MSALYFGILTALVLIYLGDFSTAFASSQLQNVTVDDTAGSPTGDLHIVYEPPGVWSAGQNCTTCEAKVDKNQVLDGTWHDVSYISDNPPSSPISATLTFDGKCWSTAAILYRLLTGGEQVSLCTLSALSHGHSRTPTGTRTCRSS